MKYGTFFGTVVAHKFKYYIQINCPIASNLIMKSKSELHHIQISKFWDVFPVIKLCANMHIHLHVCSFVCYWFLVLFTRRLSILQHEHHMVIYIIILTMYQISYMKYFNYLMSKKYFIKLFCLICLSIHQLPKLCVRLRYHQLIKLIIFNQCQSDVFLLTVLTVTWNIWPLFLHR